MVLVASIMYRGGKRYFSMMMFRIPLLQTMEKEQYFRRNDIKNGDVI